MLTLLIDLGTLIICVVTRVKLVGMLLRAGAVLGGSRSLRSHLKLANLSLRQAAVAVADGAVVLWLLLLLLGLLLVLLLGVLGHARGLAVRAVEVDAGGCGWDFALGLEEARLQVDDVVAQLVVLRLERLIELAQLLKLLDLILELLNVLLLAFAEGALGGSVKWRVVQGRRRT